MKFSTNFLPLELSELSALAQRCRSLGQRYVQTLAVVEEEGITLIYTFMDMTAGHMDNYVIAGVGKNETVPSISGSFLEAFVWENEIHDLFGVAFEGIAIDFQGAFYSTAVPEPMRQISPERKAALEKAAKIAAAKAAKEKAIAGANGSAGAPSAAGLGAASAPAEEKEVN